MLALSRLANVRGKSIRKKVRMAKENVIKAKLFLFFLTENS